MAKKSQQEQLRELRAENKRLAADNLRLQELAKRKNTTAKKTRLRLSRKVGIVTFVSLAAAFLVVGNLLFWGGNTIVKTDRFVPTVSPVIKNPEVQDAIATYTTNQLFTNFDVAKFTEEVLPPRAGFIAPAITSQIQNHTQQVIKKILVSPKFQTTWDNALEKSHSRFIASIKQNGSDGSININEVYEQLSNDLKGTRLGFLADKPLPSKVGSFKIVEGAWISNLNRLINHIDLWRSLAIVFFLLSCFLAVWLSQNRRKTVILLGIILAFCMLFTLISLRVTRELVAGSVNPEYSEAARQTAQIILHPLVVQTATLLIAFLLAGFVAWISGSTKSAKTVKARTAELFSGRLHSAIFGGSENNFSLWMGKYKRQLQWCGVVLAGLTALALRLTPAVLAIVAVSLLIFVLIIEVLAATTDIKDKQKA